MMEERRREGKRKMQWADAGYQAVLRIGQEENQRRALPEIRMDTRNVRAMKMKEMRMREDDNGIVKRSSRDVPSSPPLPTTREDPSPVYSPVRKLVRGSGSLRVSHFLDHSITS
ncbi:hypothetical protein PFISCL1PPCAC_16331 [Pristionchus fissidentatus]|uniref:Uncharacterized protein n=1 Tax=Pristionchus fissidentatus TaxID=1538716 RepID=A0AAV5W2S7_9BILA|nr:hypothetical protein PFISCL1PPCAC_12542 [Pristionchus fissidentatus]GMT25034.1 hypothetical protein PFISCL1PPCAC_16331 [Pristionchus fissidentatus]